MAGVQAMHVAGVVHRYLHPKDRFQMYAFINIDILGTIVDSGVACWLRSTVGQLSPCL